MLFSTIRVAAFMYCSSVMRPWATSTLPIRWPGSDDVNATGRPSLRKTVRVVPADGITSEPVNASARTRACRAG
jgi:hypothetical protein